MNLIEKLAEIRKMACAVEKTKKGFGYTYAPEQEVLASVTAGMNKFKVSLIPRIPEFKVEPFTYTAKRKYAKDGTPFPDETITEMLVTGTIEFTWIDNENPKDVVVVPWPLIGQQNDASQAFGSGSTYCQRYFLLKYFQSASVDGDVDEYRSKQKEKQEEEDREAAKSIVAAIHQTVTAYLEKNADKKSAITSLVKKHVIVGGKGSADYFTITNPEIATTLRDAITAFIKNNTTVKTPKNTKEIEDAE